MPKRTDIESILIVGAGPILIGQACEFDYSGTQACKALVAEGYRVILVNSNPATIMTDPGLAHATYVEPITPDVVAQIIEKEKPDALLPTMGGQTGLNTAMALAKFGVLEANGVEMIGANATAIEKAEDRELFHEAMLRIGLEMPVSRVVRSLDEARAALVEVGLPAIIRPSFTLGGTGGGVVERDADFDTMVAAGLRASPVHEILLEQSVIGWKEFEMEVVRDRADNCIIVCSIENFDPMGVHTGDSITVAPALTLTDKEYQIMRNASIACLREIGVDTGGSNVQFAVSPDDGRLLIIEMNPRVSRSSALASKATGFPIAKVAAKLAVGYTLDEVDNDITGVTPASFEPTIDYVVCKVPRFTFEKFKGSEPVLTTAMKSVGEAMSIGRSFEESIQKALRSMEIGLDGFDEVALPGGTSSDDRGDRAAMLAALAKPTPERVLILAQAMREGLSLDEIHRASRVDSWFLSRIEAIVAAEAAVKRDGLPADPDGLQRLKRLGFSDARLAKLTGSDAATVTAARTALAVQPLFKRVDTCAAEFASHTPYLYGCYEFDTGLDADEARVSDRRKVMILGGGPNRIGQGIEFDYCCVHAVYALSEAGYETIMVNCNPETVSTDYDTADRLYFEPLTAEDVIGICRAEQRNGTLAGVIVQFGGQTPLKLSHALEDAGIPILGTTADAIDLAEDRRRFQELLHASGLKQPANGIATSMEQAVAVAERVGFPMLIRPSYVLGGRAMQIVHDTEELLAYINEAVVVSGDQPVLIDSFLIDAIEVDVDAVADGHDVYIAGVMEHIEEAGIHSGDSACSLPPRSLKTSILQELCRQTEVLARALNVVGLMNVQYAIQGDTVYVLEVNPRASRTVPFVAKATGVPIAKIAARVMAGERLANFSLDKPDWSVWRNSHVAVKESVFPFNRFPGVDVILGPEMKSTGEVMGLDVDFARAFAKAQLGAGVMLPLAGTVFVSVKDRDKPAIVEASKQLAVMGFALLATGGTAAALRAAGLAVREINKVLQGPPHIVDAMLAGEVDVVINTTKGAQSQRDSFSLRRTALLKEIPYFTTVAGALAAVEAIAALKAGNLEVAPLQSYFRGSF